MSSPELNLSLEQQVRELTEREAAFRLQAVQDYRQKSERIRELENTVRALRDELGERNTYIHAFHLAQEEQQRQREALLADLGEYARMLAGVDDQRLRLERRSTRFAEAFSVLGRALKSWGTAPSPHVRLTPAPAGNFAYYFHDSPFRIHRTGTVSLRGWCFSKDLQPIAAMRLRLDEREFPVTTGLEEPEVVRVHGPLPHAPRPGFELTFEGLEGRQPFVLEALVGTAEWRTVLATSIWIVPVR